MLGHNLTKNCENASKWDEYFSDWKEIQSSVKKCSLIKRCKRANLKIQRNFIEKQNNISSDVIIKIQDPTIQFVKDSFSYDLQSFIGEVGGTLGLMLGYSFMTLFDFFEFLSQRFKTKK